MGYLDKAGLSRAFTKLKTLIDNKADVGHTHTKNQVGLGNVDNTADSTKSVKYAASSNYANSAGKANGIVVSDTRNENPAPSSTAFDKKQLTADFKMNDKINSPTGFSGTYCGVLSLAPWSETSGGHGYQLAFGYASAGHPRLALRGSDLSANAWDSWYKIYTSDDKPTLSELGAAAASHSHTKSQITDFAHTHDDRYYTESEIDSKLAAETKARTDADAALDTAYKAADTALGERIDNAETEISANSADLTGIKGLTYGTHHINFIENSNGEYTSPALDEIAEQIAQDMVCIQIQADATTVDADTLNKLTAAWPRVILLITEDDTVEGSTFTKFMYPVGYSTNGIYLFAYPFLQYDTEDQTYYEGFMVSRTGEIGKPSQYIPLMRTDTTWDDIEPR